MSMPQWLQDAITSVPVYVYVILAVILGIILLVTVLRGLFVVALIALLLGSGIVGTYFLRQHYDEIKQNPAELIDRVKISIDERR